MPNTSTRVVSLNFRDRLRKEADAKLREFFVRGSSYFDRRPSAAWHQVCRDLAYARRPWGPVLVLLDDLLRADAPLEEVLEFTAILETYLRIRYEQYQLPATSAQIEAEENAPLTLRKAA
jgi:hypothetical protein